MKKSHLLINVTLAAGFIWSPVLLLGQVDSTMIEKQVEKATLDVQVQMNDIQKQLEEANKEMEKAGQHLNMNLDIGITNDQKLQLGLYLEDIDFQEAYEKHYPYNYGVLVSGVVNGGNAERAGIVKGDIIMEFDGEKVRYENHLTSLRDTKTYGDTVTLTLFRNENIIERSLTFSPPAPKTEVTKNGKVILKKQKLFPGYGGGGPMATFVDFKFPVVSDLLEINGFARLDNSTITYYGGYGMGNVSHGLFIGGGGAGFTMEQQIPRSDGTGFKSYTLNSGYGGAMVHKKKALFTKKLVLDFGVMIGGGSTDLTIASTDGDITWSSNVETMDSQSFTFKKDYFVYQPTIGALIRITDWFGIDANVGYLGTYSKNNEWKDANFDFSVDGGNPDILNSMSYTVGIWFGY